MLDFSCTKEADDFGLIPKGIYKVAVTGAEFRAPKDPSKKDYLNLTFKVTEGEYEGRLVWSMFSVYSENEKAKKIAMEQLKRLMVQAGKENPEVLHSPAELLGLQCLAEIRTQGPNNGYDAKNTIGKFTSLSAARPELSGNTEEVPF